jgi:hypothetical protein
MIGPVARMGRRVTHTEYSMAEKSEGTDHLTDLGTTESECSGVSCK